MAFTVEEIRNIINSGGLEPNSDDVVLEGKLLTPTGKSVEFTIHHGWDPTKALLCDNTWGMFNCKLLSFIKEQKYDADTLRKISKQIQIGDAHWDWFNKSCLYNTDEYNWFFLMAADKPQAACLIYHPKPSLLCTGNIFYIEYLASAPWNRKNPMIERSFKEVATTLLRYVVSFGKNNLNLRYGFCLHALQSAVGFYASLGMVNHPPADKVNLPYFEMPEEHASKFAGG